jgi:hypothetical protein
MPSAFSSCTTTASEFDYVAGAEEALRRARERPWTVVSVKEDWATVFSQT